MNMNTAWRTEYFGYTLPEQDIDIERALGMPPVERQDEENCTS